MPFDICWWNTGDICRGSTESTGINNVFRLMHVLWVGVWHRRRQNTSNILMDHSYKPIGYMLSMHKSSSVTCIYGWSLTTPFTYRNHLQSSRWRHQMETFSALLELFAGNSPVPGEFPAQRPVTPSFDVFCDLHPIKRWSKQSRGWWLEMPSRSLWHHCNVIYCTECTHYFVLLYFVVTTSFMVSAINCFVCYLHLFRITFQSYDWEFMAIQFLALSQC